MFCWYKKLNSRYKFKIIISIIKFKIKDCKQTKKLTIHPSLDIQNWPLRNTDKKSYFCLRFVRFGLQKEVMKRQKCAANLTSHAPRERSANLLSLSYLEVQWDKERGGLFHTFAMISSDVRWCGYR